MAEHTKAHLWINTTIALCALAASLASAAISWGSFKMKTENLEFLVTTDRDCGLPADDTQTNSARYFTEACWNLTITNNSERRTSIVKFDGYQFSLSDAEDHRTAFPIVIDGGDAKTFRIHGYLTDVEVIRLHSDYSPDLYDALRAQTAKFIIFKTGRGNIFTVNVPSMFKFHFREQQTPK
jgi:hypothetical protein